MQTLGQATLLLLAVCHTHGQFHNSHSHVQQALFVRDIDAPSPYNEHLHRYEHTSDRVPRQSTSSLSSSTMDQTVQGILEWLQGKYSNARKARQEVQTPSRQYLPQRPNPTTTQKPRPFQTNGYQTTFGGSTPTGYPFPQSPTPSFNIPETPAPYNPTSTGGTVPPYSQETVPPYKPSPGPSSSPQPPYGPPSSPQAPFLPDEGPSKIPFLPSTGGSSPGFTSTGSVGGGSGGGGSSGGSGFSSTGPGVSPTGPSGGGGGVYFPPSPGMEIGNGIDSDESHPPHIHEINVQCAKDMMTIDIEFNRPFNGVVYSKGFYNNPECRYVTPNSGQTKYSFTVMLNSCGTQFVDQFSEGKQAYLENVLVLQNEPGIQEVWDTIRSVRCLWEGNLNKALSVALSVGMLSQEIVTFSGDTATARLDIQMGRGPFASAANGLVKIGETMTLVVTVEGDPGFNVLVRQCVARDNDPTSGNVVQLTDDRGCVVKPKLMGAFQTTRNPETNAVIAYAFFQAFKFPDVMDLTIECNVELCKTECAPCSDPNQKYEPGRRRRSADNSTLDLTDPVTVGRTLRVFLPEDLEESRQSAAMVINVGAAGQDTVCLSSSVFLMASTLLLSLLAASCVCSAALWLRMQHQQLRK
ncbi:uncharacterized protein LOC128994989 isoform X2 [Macrosteles quadrilineatus]|uniref:uncharacterized protein LOC128994989 isoform X2 n=1 Tax=Macrosteles quadrilineatus TaxID=74068 RepID=UPI0023E2273A|nr:uncharacterized protein LOC128994989 isoform X2 [Macrosteles quadrilineatus]